MDSNVIQFPSDRTDTAQQRARREMFWRRLAAFYAEGMDTLPDVTPSPEYSARLSAILGLTDR